MQGARMGGRDVDAATSDAPAATRDRQGVRGGAAADHAPWRRSSRGILLWLLPGPPVVTTTGSREGDGDKPFKIGTAQSRGGSCTGRAVATAGRTVLQLMALQTTPSSAMVSPVGWVMGWSHARNLSVPVPNPQCSLGRGVSCPYQGLCGRRSRCQDMVYCDRRPTGLQHRRVPHGVHQQEAVYLHHHRIRRRRTARRRHTLRNDTPARR